MQVPIIIPQVIPIRRDCIVVSGKRYCEDADISGKELAFMVGVVLLGFAIVGSYVFWALDSAYEPRYTFGIPVAVIVAVLLAYGLS